MSCCSHYKTDISKWFWFYKNSRERGEHIADSDSCKNSFLLKCKVQDIQLVPYIQTSNLQTFRYTNKTLCLEMGPRGLFLPLTIQKLNVGDLTRYSLVVAQEVRVWGKGGDTSQSWHWAGLRESEEGVEHTVPGTQWAWGSEERRGEDLHPQIPKPSTWG